MVDWGGLEGKKNSISQENFILFNVPRTLIRKWQDLDLVWRHNGRRLHRSLSTIERDASHGPIWRTLTCKVEWRGNSGKERWKKWTYRVPTCFACHIELTTKARALRSGNQTLWWKKIDTGQAKERRQNTKGGKKWRVNWKLRRSSLHPLRGSPLHITMVSRTNIHSSFNPGGIEAALVSSTFEAAYISFGVTSHCLKEW